MKPLPIVNIFGEKSEEFENLHRHSSKDGMVKNQLKLLFLKG